MVQIDDLCYNDPTVALNTITTYSGNLDTDISGCSYITGGAGESGGHLIWAPGDDAQGWEPDHSRNDLLLLCSP